MRVLLMILLLANLGVLAWFQWHDDSGRLPRGEPVGEIGKRLVLVSERDDLAEPAQLSDSRPDEPGDRFADEAPVRCATVGPFEQREIAEVGQERLRDLGIEALVREAAGQIRAGYWVYLPPFPSRNAARDTQDELRARGVQDLFIVTASDQRNAISLGLFTTAERADQRAAEIGRLGFTPRVAERFRDAPVYWLNFHEPVGGSLEPERLGVMGAGETVPEKREIPCDEIAVPAVGA